MPITLQDGFIISANFPVDYRFTVTNVSDLNGITKLYVGLKTYVTSIDKTYVYTSTGWKVDSGGPNVENHNNGIWTQNIFASGSVKRDNELFLGTVSNSEGDRSFYYNLWSRGLTDKDESRILSYSYRSSNGVDYDTMSHRIENQFIPNLSTKKFGASIDFNVRTNLSKNVGKGSPPHGLLISSPSVSGDRTPKIGISEKQIDLFISNNDIPSFKTIIVDQSLHIGYNILDNIFEKIELPSYRMNLYEYLNPYAGGYGDDSSGADFSKFFSWRFENRPSNTEQFITSMEIVNQYFLPPPDSPLSTKAVRPSSPIRFCVDQSSYDWDFFTPREFTLRSFPTMIRKIEHRLEKVQMYSQATIETPFKGKNSNGIDFQNQKILNDLIGETRVNVLYLPTNGNSFEIGLTSGSTKPSFSNILPLPSSIIANQPAPYEFLLPDGWQNEGDEPPVFSQGYYQTLLYKFPRGTIINLRLAIRDFDNVTSRSSWRQETLSNIRPAYLQIIDEKFIGVNKSTEGIRSEITENTFYGLTNSDKLFVFHERLNQIYYKNDNNDDQIWQDRRQHGDHIILRSIGTQSWCVVHTNRTSRITQRGWYHRGGLFTDYVVIGPELSAKWIPTELTIPRPYYWSYRLSFPTSFQTSVYYLSSLDDVGVWNAILDSRIISSVNVYDYFTWWVQDSQNWYDTPFPNYDFPGQWTFNRTLSQNGPSRWTNTYDSFWDENNNFRFQISVDGNRIIRVRGTLVGQNYYKDREWTPAIDVYLIGGPQSVKRLYFRSDDKRKNIWSIGQLLYKNNNPYTQILRPKCEGNWAFVEMKGFAYSQNVQYEINFSDSIISINKEGDMFLEFDAEPSVPSLKTDCYNLYLEVYVPEFSYIAEGPDFKFINGPQYDSGN